MNSEDPRLHYAQLVRHALTRADSFSGMPSQPTDVAVVPNFSGSADRIQVWLIFESGEDAEAVGSRDRSWKERVASVLIDAGFPDEGLDSLVLRFTSLDEIESHGGRQGFFR